MSGASKLAGVATLDELAEKLADDEPLDGRLTGPPHRSGGPVAYDIFGATPRRRFDDQARAVEVENNQRAARRAVRAMTREERLLAARAEARPRWKDGRLTDREIRQAERRIGLELMQAPIYYFSSNVHHAALVGFPGVS